MQLFYILLLSMAAPFICLGSSINHTATDSTGHKKIAFVHSVEVGALFKVGYGKSHINDHLDGTLTVKGSAIPDFAKLLLLRMEHGVEFRNHLQTGIGAGADIFIEPHDVQVLVPIMLYVKYTLPLKGKILPMIEERLGYAFYFHNRDSDPIVTVQGVEGGTASETLIGVGLKAFKKITPQLMFGYRFQHINSKTVFHTGNSLVAQHGYNTALPDEVKITTNSVQHFIYLSLGLKF